MTLVYVTLLVGGVIRLDGKSHSASDMRISFAVQFIILTIPMLAICYKTGERPRWRWSWKNTDED